MEIRLATREDLTALLAFDKHIGREELENLIGPVFYHFYLRNVRSIIKIDKEDFSFPFRQRETLFVFIDSMRPHRLHIRPDTPSSSAINTL